MCLYTCVLHKKTMYCIEYSQCIRFKTIIYECAVHLCLIYIEQHSEQPTTDWQDDLVKLQIWANIGALIIRIGFWVPLFYNYNKEQQK